MLPRTLEYIEKLKVGTRNNSFGLQFIPVLFLLGGVLAICLLSFQQWIALIVLLSLVVLILSIYLSLDHPDVLLFIVLLLNITYFPYKSATFFIIIFLCLVIYLKHKQDHAKYRLDPIVVLWLLLAVLAVITIPKWKNILHGLQGSINLIVMPLLLYLAIKEGWLPQLSAKKMFTIFTPVLIIYLVAQVIVVVIFSKELPSLGSEINIMAYHSLDLGWGKSNYIAAILVYLVLAVISAKNLFGKSVLNKIYVNTLIIAGIFPVVLILSRGAVLSFVCGLLVYWYFYNSFYEKKIKIWNWVIIGFVSSIVLFDYMYKLWQRFSQSKVDPSIMIRFYIWKESVSKIKKNILIGAGPGQNMFTDFNYISVNDPHNIFLRYGIDLGVLAIIIIIIILLLPLIQMYSLYKRKANNINNIVILFVPSYLSAIINSQIEVVISSYLLGMLFWLFYALMWQSISLCQQE